VSTEGLQPAAIRGDGAIRVARWSELEPGTAYGILRVRSAVFVVEQRCPYLDLDGRDLEPDALQLWIDVEGEVVSCLRVLRLASGESKIGRVATDPAHRSLGYASMLMRRALELVDPPVLLNAQAHLGGWYAHFGFAVSGAGWDEDGIPHLPMRLG
jgi:ElaA protein